MDTSLENSAGALAIPSGSLGSGLYDFGYQLGVLPPAGASKTASQIESGGSGWDFGSTLRDITSAWMTVQTAKAARPESPAVYRRADDGNVYATDPAYRQQGVVSVSTQTLLMVGLVVVVGVLLMQD